MRRKLGIMTAAVVAVGALGLLGCGKTETSLDAAQQTVMIQVENDDGFGVSNVRVRAWIVDVDLPVGQREPIDLGAAPTTNDGVVRFTYLATRQPYICGFKIEEVNTTNVVAQHAANVLDRLSDSAGQLTVRVGN